MSSRDVYQTRLLSPIPFTEVAPSRLVRRGGGPGVSRWQRYGWGPGDRGAKPSKLGANVGRMQGRRTLASLRKHSEYTQWTGRAIFERKCLYNSVTHGWNSLRAIQVSGGTRLREINCEIDIPCDWRSYSGSGWIVSIIVVEISLHSIFVLVRYLGDNICASFSRIFQIFEKL